MGGGAPSIPEWLLHYLGPEDLLLVQVDGAVAVPHPVGPRVRRDVFSFSYKKKQEEREQEGERERERADII